MAFFHKHPFKPYIPKNSTKLIIGTLPPPRFSTGKLHEKDVNFSYGSYFNSLWLYIDEIYNLNLHYDNSEKAIVERKQFLKQHNIGICDMVESAKREKIDASDLGMTTIKLRNILGYLIKHPTIKTLLFIGGNSKNGPEYLFRKHLKIQELKLQVVTNKVPRIHTFTLNNRTIKTVSLTSSSGSANRAIGSMPLYKQLKAANPNFTTFDFRVMQYREFL